MRMALRKDPGLLKKMNSLSNTSKNMAMEVGEPSPSLQVFIYKHTSPSLSLSLSLSLSKGCPSTLFFSLGRS
jgi:hypothetical protein